MRGTEGFGLFDGQEMHMYHATQENKIMRWLRNYNSSLIMFHHRFPTSTVNAKRAAHPFSTKEFFGDDCYVLVHNGHISNSDELYDKHVKLGITYQSLLGDGTFNDSESLLWEFALTMEGKQEELETVGSVAFVCMKLHDGKLDKLYFGRNNNPLMMYRDNEGIALASEGAGEEIKAHTLYTFNYKLKRLTTRLFSIPSWKVWEPKETVESHMPYKDDEDYNPYDVSVESGIRSYEPGYQPKEYGGAGAYLKPAMKAKFDKFLATKEQQWGVDYDYDKDGNKIPIDTCSQQQIELDDKEEDNELAFSASLNEPTDSEIFSRTIGFLMAGKGNFEATYEIVEDKYIDLSSTDNIRELKLLEKVMETILEDDEFKNSESISSLWEELRWTRTLPLMRP